MRITLLQTDIAWGKPSENMDFAEKMLAQAPLSDIYVLPEMWTTGFVTEPDTVVPVIDKSTCVALDWMKKNARSTGSAICGSIATNISGNRYVNRFYFVHPDGTTDTYDKRHLFSYGGENLCYSSGKRRAVIEYKGIRFLLAICYDLRFPVWMRNQDDYDAIIIVANWPETRQDVWNILLKARAMENQCYVIGCNRIGSDPTCRYAGGSMVVNPKGKILAEGMTGNPQIITAEIDMEELETFRNKFKVLEDRDKFNTEWE